MICFYLIKIRHNALDNTLENKNKNYFLCFHAGITPTNPELFTSLNAHFL